MCKFHSLGTMHAHIPHTQHLNLFPFGVFSWKSLALSPEIKASSCPSLSLNESQGVGGGNFCAQKNLHLRAPRWPIALSTSSSLFKSPGRWEKKKTLPQTSTFLSTRLFQKKWWCVSVGWFLTFTLEMVVSRFTYIHFEKKAVLQEYYNVVAFRWRIPMFSDQFLISPLKKITVDLLKSEFFCTGSS